MIAALVLLLKGATLLLLVCCSSAFCLQNAQLLRTTISISTALSATEIPMAGEVELQQRLKQRLADLLEKPNNSPNSSQGDETNSDEKSSPLPIYDVLDDISTSLRSKPNLLLQAAPGAGKTTLVPLQLLLDNMNEEILEEDKKSTQEMLEHSQNYSQSNSQIWVVAPRRVAVRSAAQRMAKLLHQAPGETVGYAMRDEARVGAHTQIKVVTDGVLLNELQRDPELKGIGTIVLDEFHERGVGSDTCFALLREVQETIRSDNLKIVVMSATLLGGTDSASGGNASGGTAGDQDSDQTNNSETAPSAGSKLVQTLGGPSNCGIVESEGRQYPITIQWADQVARKLPKGSGILPLGSLLQNRKLLTETMANVIESAALPQAPERGDILVFLPGVAECKKVVQELSTRTPVTNVADVYALYGAMPKEEQDRVLYPNLDNNKQTPQKQRIIVSTPIAEASLTIPSVTCVVDSGLRREPRCDADTGMSRLVSTKISKASAVQRAGRAGRVREGLCLRLYSQHEFETSLVEQSPPEISSTDLAPILLLLADWGCASRSDILDEMPFVDPPGAESLEQAERLLTSIGALETTSSDNPHHPCRFKLTDFGRKISKLPCHPRLAACISKAMENDEADDSILAAAITAAFCLDNDSSVPTNNNKNNDDPNLADSVRSLLMTGQGYKKSALLRFASRVGGSRRREAIQTLQTNEPNIVNKCLSNLGQAMLPGFVDLVGERKGDASYDSSNYLLALGKSCRLGFRTSPPYILALDTSTGADRISRIRSYVPLSKDLLEGVAIDRALLYTVPSKGYQVRAKQVYSVGSIELSSSPLPSPSPEDVSKTLLDAMTNDLGGIDNALLKYLAPKERDTFEGLIARIKLDKILEPDNANHWPECFDAFGNAHTTHEETTQQEILTNLVEPWLGSIQSLKELNALEIFQSTLTPEQQRYLDSTYPLSIDAPDGSTIPLRYVDVGGDKKNDAGGDNVPYRPTANAKLQQFFGAQETPTVGPLGKSLSITLSLTSPAGKPLAETSDLPFFWREVYPSIRSEMRGRYPKHPWPEDPLSAVATRKTKKQLSKDDDNDNTESTTKKGRGKSKKRRNKKR